MDTMEWLISNLPLIDKDTYFIMTCNTFFSFEEKIRLDVEYAKLLQPSRKRPVGEIYFDLRKERNKIEDWLY